MLNTPDELSVDDIEVLNLKCQGALQSEHSSNSGSDTDETGGAKPQLILPPKPKRVKTLQQLQKRKVKFVLLTTLVPGYHNINRTCTISHLPNHKTMDSVLAKHLLLLLILPVTNILHTHIRRLLNLDLVLSLMHITKLLKISKFHFTSPKLVFSKKKQNHQFHKQHLLKLQLPNLPLHLHNCRYI